MVGGYSLTCVGMVLSQMLIAPRPMISMVISGVVTAANAVY